MLRIPISRGKINITDCVTDDAGVFGIHPGIAEGAQDFVQSRAGVSPPNIKLT